MNEFAKTGAVAGVAILLSVIAWNMGPRAVSHQQFSDEGEQFFPAFTDGASATASTTIPKPSESVRVVLVAGT